MNTDPELLKKLIQKGNLLPQEEMLEVARKKGSLNIGIPKETSFQERRVALVPEAVSLLVANGHQVLLESNAGEGAHFTDNEYSEAGAQIIYDRKAIYQSDIILKVAPPSEEEIAYMPGNQTFISALQLATLGILVWVGVLTSINWIFFIALFISAVLFIQQQWSIRHRDRDACFKAFLNNHYIGMVIAVGIGFSFGF